MFYGEGGSTDKYYNNGRHYTLPFFNYHNTITNKPPSSTSPVYIIVLGLYNLRRD